MMRCPKHNILLVRGRCNICDAHAERDVVDDLVDVAAVVAIDTMLDNITHHHHHDSSSSSSDDSFGGGGGSFGGGGASSDW